MYSTLSYDKWHSFSNPGPCTHPKSLWACLCPSYRAKCEFVLACLLVGIFTDAWWLLTVFTGCVTGDRADSIMLVTNFLPVNMKYESKWKIMWIMWGDMRSTDRNRLFKKKRKRKKGKTKKGPWGARESVSLHCLWLTHFWWFWCCHCSQAKCFPCPSWSNTITHTWCWYLAHDSHGQEILRKIGANWSRVGISQPKLQLVISKPLICGLLYCHRQSFN